MHWSAWRQVQQLNSQENLWPLLLVITSRKATKLRLRESRQKRGGGKQFTEADVTQEPYSPLGQIVSREPTPEFAAAASEQCDALLSLLTPQMREIALAKLEGLTNEEIARQHDTSVRTIERKLK